MNGVKNKKQIEKITEKITAKGEFETFPGNTKQ